MATGGPLTHDLHPWCFSYSNIPPVSAVISSGTHIDTYSWCVYVVIAFAWLISNECPRDPSPSLALKADRSLLCTSFLYGAGARGEL